MTEFDTIQFGMDQQASGHYRPRLQDGESSQQGVDLFSVDQCEAIGEMDDSLLVGAPEARAAAGEEGRVPDVQAKTVQTTVEKRKRGRPPKGQLPKGQPSKGQPKATKTTPPPRKKKDEEDVCFICFDGGSLVLCDRR